jgi:Ca-activated chloride channel family protein
MNNHKHAAQWLLWISRIIALALCLLVLAVPSRAVLLEDLGAPQLILDPQGDLKPALLTETALTIDIVGEAAEAVLVQSFINPQDAWVNGVYALPVPDQAAVHGLVIELGGRRIVGQINERAAARRQFQAAAQEGRRASLLEQISADLFHLKVANIPPKGEIKVVVEISLSVQRQGDWLSLRFPTTVTPKYALREETADLPKHNPGDNTLLARWVSWQPNTSESPIDVNYGPVLPASDTLSHPLMWQVTLRSHGDVARVITPQHNGKVRQRGKSLIVSPRFGPAEMDRDWVIRWRLKPSAAPIPSLLLSEHRGELYAELAVLPPQPEYLPAPMPRELVLVLDVSGSMAGEPIEQAIAAVSRALAELRPMDRFDLVVFENETEALFGDLLPAAPDTLAEAQDFLDDLEAGGGTEMLPALTRALDYGLTSTGTVRQVLFITDGAVTGESSLFKHIERHLGQSRLLTLAIGAAPNTRFMRRAAQLGKGLYRHVDGASVTTVMTELLAQMSQPVLTDLQVEWPAAVELAGSEPGDLYLGEPVRQRVRLLAVNPVGDVVVSGLRNGQPWQVAVPLNSARTLGVTGRVMAGRWAQEHIDWLLDNAYVSGVPVDALRDEVLSLGLEYALVTPFTSFVAIEEWISRPPTRDEGTYRVPNAPPHGAMHFAQTALGIELWLYLGLVSVLLGALIWAMSGEHEQ